MKAVVASLDGARKRVEIDARYKQTIDMWSQQLGFSIRLIRAEYKMKCYLAQQLRDAELLILDRDS